MCSSSIAGGKQGAGTSRAAGSVVCSSNQAGLGRAQCGTSQAKSAF